MEGDRMPETPEMEIYKNYLNKWVKGKRIIDINVFRAKSINLESEEFCQLIIGKNIQDISRRGKYLVFYLEDHRYLLTHMMLDGRLYYLPTENIEMGSLSEVMHSDAEDLKQKVNELPGKASVVFGLSDGSALFFCSLTLGYLHYLDKDLLDKKLRELGKDPLDPNFVTEDFIQLLEGKRGMIKPWLMNQKNIAGVGNAYSNEGLFGCGILPTRLISSLSMDEKVSLYQSLVTVLRDSIRLGGDMEEKFAPWDDFIGGFNQCFQVYDRAGEPCRSCNGVIQKKEIGGRNAFICVHCQK